MFKSMFLISFMDDELSKQELDFTGIGILRIGCRSLEKRQS